MWGLIKRRVRKERPQTLDRLKDLLFEYPTLPTTKTLCKALYRSFVDRCDAVVANGGWRMNH